MQVQEDSLEGGALHSQEIEQYLTFMLGGKIYGLAILNIKEIIEYGDITEVPMTPDFISGVINLRGNVVPVVDLSQRFSGQVMQQEVKNDDLRIEIGVTVDMVNEVLDIPMEEIEAAPSLGNQIQTNFISGMAKMNGKLLISMSFPSSEAFSMTHPRA